MARCLTPEQISSEALALSKRCNTIAHGLLSLATREANLVNDGQSAIEVYEALHDELARLKTYAQFMGNDPSFEVGTLPRFTISTSLTENFDYASMDGSALKLGSDDFGLNAGLVPNFVFFEPTKINIVDGTNAANSGEYTVTSYSALQFAVSPSFSVTDTENRDISIEVIEAAEVSEPNINHYGQVFTFLERGLELVQLSYELRRSVTRAKELRRAITDIETVTDLYFGVTISGKVVDPGIDLLKESRALAQRLYSPNESETDAWAFPFRIKASTSDSLPSLSFDADSASYSNYSVLSVDGQGDSGNLVETLQVGDHIRLSNCENSENNGEYVVMQVDEDNGNVAIYKNATLTNDETESTSIVVELVRRPPVLAYGSMDIDADNGSGVGTLTFSSGSSTNGFSYFDADSGNIEVRILGATNAGNLGRFTASGDPTVTVLTLTEPLDTDETGSSLVVIRER